MRYRDLIQFEPIETVIQLRDADKKDAAGHLVRTYVISDHMADQLAGVIIPQLQFESPKDNKGILIVGNYGTGKSHLMSLISAVAEHADLLQDVEHPEVRKAGEAIAGRFKVLRVEIGSVTGSLRDILLNDLELALEAWGTPYTFPPASELANNKDVIIKAVGAFRQKYPDCGILLVVDELLDYLRTREEMQLILDLGFLRELGEVAALTPFRFVGGLQETLFDSPRFIFVAEQLRRVRDRFAQVSIAREDIAYVVAHRLLRKTDEQLARIANHLRRFTPLYHGMAERLDELVELFPIHPAYIETFERVYVAEKREVLKTFSQAMSARLDAEVPKDQPGLISYDHYWDVLRLNPAMRTLPGVAQVVEKSNVLEGRISNAYTRPHLLPMALRIIHGLSVHRLTTSDIHVPLGPSAEELRDNLFLHVQMPEATADFLLDQVQVTLREIMRTVSGQYISYNEENGQYYLDLKKDIDFDAKISERGESLDKGGLNRHFFDALRQVLDLSTTSYVTGHRIWFYELPWQERKVTRPGYLFFGAPDERSTAQPPRDFYVYLLPPFESRDWHDEERPDAVIFQLVALDDHFEEIVRLYAGARAMASESATHREVYQEKADGYLQKLTSWLKENLRDHLQVIYQGVAQPISEALYGTQSSASQSVRQLFDLVAAQLLEPNFEECYPQYPAFTRLQQPVSEAARPATAMEAVRSLAGHGRTNLARAVLEALGLVDEEGNVRPYDSPYAERFLEVLQEKSQGQVVNRGELIEQVSAGLEPIDKDLYFRLEPEWVVVTLLALVYNGDIVLSLDGRETLDASNIERAATKAMEALTDFRFYKQPHTLPLNIWTMIFEGLGLNAALVRDENARRHAVEDLQKSVNTELEWTAKLEGRLQQSLRLWNQPVFTDNLTYHVQQGQVVGTDRFAVMLSSVDLLPHLRGYMKFLDVLGRFNTPGKLRNLKMTISEVKESLKDRRAVQRVECLVDMVDRLQAITTYFAEAQANLPADHPWSERASAMREKVLQEVRRGAKGEETRDEHAILIELEGLKKEYIAAYSELHRRLTLGPAADDRRQQLYKDSRLTAVETLSRIDLLSSSELDGWKRAATGLPTCREYHEGSIGDSPTCPVCHLRPVEHSGATQAEQMLVQLDMRLDDLLVRWRQALRANLTSETAMHSRKAMTPAERKPIEGFLAQSDDDTNIPQGFVDSSVRALHGIEAVTLPVDDLVEALKAGGLPCTVQELQGRFRNFVQKAIRGRDESNTRLTLDK